MSVARLSSTAELKALLTVQVERLAMWLSETSSGLGKFNKALSSKSQLRFGSKGSLSLELQRRRGSWVEHGGIGRGGPIQLIQHAFGCSWTEAVERGWDFAGGAAATWKPISKAPTRSAPLKNNLGRYHLEIAEACTAAAGTPAEQYLREHRRITGPLPPEAQFHPRVWHKESGRAWPALVLVAADAGGTRRVQVVFLDPGTGGKAPIQPSKKTFGADASHVPVVFAARHDDGPIRITEGPEDAATIWSLTGDCTMATLGSGSLGKPEIPPGSHVVICGDTTDEGRAAARRAAAKYVTAKCRVELAFATGAKDFNAALQQFGSDNTLAMLQQAAPFRAHGLSPYYPAPTELRDAALHRQNTAILETVDISVRRTAILREIEWRYGQITNDPDMSPAEKRSIRRKVTSEVEAQYGRAPDKRRMLVTGAQGTGKTSTTLRALANTTSLNTNSDDLVIHLYEPTLKKAYEIESDYRKLAGPTSLPVKVVLGRGALDPERIDGTTMCLRHKVVNAAARRGVEVRKDICPTCPFRSTCGSLKQERSIEAMGNRGIFVHAHSYLFHPTPAPTADLVVVDEAVTIAAIDDVLELSPDSLTNIVPFSGSDLANVMLANETLKQVAAILRLPDSLSQLRRVGIFESDLRFVKKMIDDAIEAGKPSINGEMTDDAIAGALDAWQVDALFRASALVGAVIREIQQPRSTFTGISYDPARRVRMDDHDERLPRLRVHRLRKMVNVTQGASLLLLDGTGSPLLNRVNFGDLEHVHTPVERDAFVIGTTGKSYSRQSLTGMDRHGVPMPKRVDGARKLRAEIPNVIDFLINMTDGGTGLLVATKKAADVFRAEQVMPDSSDVTHFGALRGLNTWEECSWGLNIGRESVSIEQLEDMTRAVFAGDPSSFSSFATPVPSDWPYQQWPYRATRGRRMRDGTVQPVEVDVHPDPRAQEILEQVREAEVMQGVDRPRPVFNHRVLALLNDLVLDVTYDRTWRHDELVAGGNRFDIAWARSGILPLGAGDLHRAHGRLFPSISAAKDALASDGNNGGVAQICSLLGHPPIISFRRKGQRGKASRALIDPVRHPDALRALRAALGDVEAVSAMVGGVPPVTAPLQVVAPLAAPAEPPAKPPLEIVQDVTEEARQPLSAPRQAPLLLLFPGRPILLDPPALPAASRLRGAAPPIGPPA